jgi:putative transcriptional regulator
MSKKAFDKIKEGLTEAIAVASGDAQPARFHVAEDIDVRAVRRKAAMSQEDFASVFGFTINQIRDWEQGRTRPTGGLRAYLTMIDAEPGKVRELLAYARARGRRAA